MLDSEYDSSNSAASIDVAKAKAKAAKGTGKRKSLSAAKSVARDHSRSDIEFDGGSLGRSEVETLKKGPVKRKSSAKSISSECSRTSKKKATQQGYDIFNLDGETPTINISRAPAASVLYNRVANGQTKRTVHTEGSFQVELKVYNSADVQEGGDDLWKKTLLWLKLRTDEGTPHWAHLHKFIRQVGELFADSEATFYSNKIKFR